MKKNYSRGRRALNPGDMVVLISCLALLLWLFFPGLGLDLFGLQKKLGWSHGTFATVEEALQDLPETELVQAIRELPEAPVDRTNKYDRKLFGPAWADVDHNGCDTRNDILNRDLVQISHRPGTHGCVVISGELAEPYTGQTLSFTRGDKTSLEVQIDHVVALGQAWETGAQLWDPERKKLFANDPLNLLAVDGPANVEKGKMDASEWLPSNTEFRCPYVARQVAIKQTWDLWATPEERLALATVAAECPDEPLPTGSILETIHP